ncbi:hypothetical protein BASA60_005880 [Batrachochytrium salamandrivorans]|nr:hypothetical protein BASA60_005880 [Batrachochytrium salamandrivorans]
MDPHSSTTTAEERRSTATASHISTAMVGQLVPVLQALDMGMIAAVRSQGELHQDMERLAAELQVVSHGLGPPPDIDPVAERVVAARRRIMALQKKLRLLEDSVHKITVTLDRRITPTPTPTSATTTPTSTTLP